MSFNVLIVDDSIAMRAFVRRVLELSGFSMGTCLTAGDGKEALELIRANSIDVILTDINMPVMDGEQFVRELSAEQSLKSIPVVVISTDASDHRVRRMLELGARGYVKKPFLPETVREIMERVLGVACVSPRG